MGIMQFHLFPLSKISFKSILTATLFGVMVIFFASCDSEDDIPEKPLAEKIIGTWEVYYTEDAMCDDPAENIIRDFSDSNCYMEGPLELCVVFTHTFREDMTLVSYFQGIAITPDGVADTSEMEVALDYVLTGNSVTACRQDMPEDCDMFSVFVPSDGQMIMEGQLSPGPGCVREYRLQKK